MQAIFHQYYFNDQWNTQNQCLLETFSASIFKAKGILSFLWFLYEKFYSLYSSVIEQNFSCTSKTFSVNIFIHILSVSIPCINRLRTGLLKWNCWHSFVSQMTKHICQSCWWWWWCCIPWSTLNEKVTLLNEIKINLVSVSTLF